MWKHELLCRGWVSKQTKHWQQPTTIANKTLQESSDYNQWSFLKVLKTFSIEYLSIEIKAENFDVLKIISTGNFTVQWSVKGQVASARFCVSGCTFIFNWIYVTYEGDKSHRYELTDWPSFVGTWVAAATRNILASILLCSQVVRRLLAGGLGWYCVYRRNSTWNSILEKKKCF